MAEAWEFDVGPFPALLDWVTRQLPFEERQELLPHLAGTAKRLFQMFQNEVLLGYSQDPVSILGAVFPDKYSEMVLVRNIPIYSTCVHHLVTFYGIAHVAYIPDGQVVGISKLARLVECYARRLQIQERLTRQVAETLSEVLKPLGTACVIEATHLCMCARGVEKPGSETVTSVLTGEFLTKSEVRAELFSLINHGRK